MGVELAPGVISLFCQRVVYEGFSGDFFHGGRGLYTRDCFFWGSQRGQKYLQTIPCLVYKRPVFLRYLRYFWDFFTFSFRARTLTLLLYITLYQTSYSRNIFWNFRLLPQNRKRKHSFLSDEPSGDGQPSTSQSSARVTEKKAQTKKRKERPPMKSNRFLPPLLVFWFLYAMSRGALWCALKCSPPSPRQTGEHMADRANCAHINMHAGLGHILLFSQKDGDFVRRNAQMWQERWFRLETFWPQIIIKCHILIKTLESAFTLQKRPTTATCCASRQMVPNRLRRQNRSWIWWNDG